MLKTILFLLETITVWICIVIVPMLLFHPKLSSIFMSEYTIMSYIFILEVYTVSTLSA